jgi:tRNA pseudouridine55 synthase
MISRSSSAKTETLDLEGKVVATSDVRPIAAEIAAVLPQFTGPIEQVPPAYSALMIDGVRAYDRRAGVRRWICPLAPSRSTRWT